MRRRKLLMGPAILCFPFFTKTSSARDIVSKPARTLDHSATAPINVVTLGQVGHGKTTLTSAISRIQAERQLASFVPASTIKNPPATSLEGTILRVYKMEYRIRARRYSQSDAPEHSDYVKLLIAGPQAPDAAILVVSGQDGPMPETREHILLARQAGISSLVVFMSKVESVPSDLLDLIELEVRELLTSYDFQGDMIPIIHGSSTMALTGRGGALGADAVRRLLRTLDRCVAAPTARARRHFAIAVDAVRTNGGGSFTVAGVVEQGTIRVGDVIEVVGLGTSDHMECLGVRVMGGRRTLAWPGDKVEVVLRGTGDLRSFQRGSILAVPGTVAAKTTFGAEVYLLTAAEGNPGLDLVSGQRCSFSMRGIDVAGVVFLPNGLERAAPGDNLRVDIRLDTRVVMIPQQHFKMSADGRKIAVGVISALGAV